MINPIMDQATKLARRGYHILPLYEPILSGCSCGDPACSRAGKHPRVPNGVHDATADQKLIEEYWKRWPLANIGLATGSKSSISVVDVDGAQGRATLAKLMIGQQSFPKAATVLTGRGEHYYVRTGTLRVRNRVLGSGIDLRGDGGYVVTIGSRHVSGKSYRPALWGRVVPTPFMPVALPDWLHALIAPELPKFEEQTPAAETSRSYVHDAVRDELARLRGTKEGGRNNALNLCTFRIGQLIGVGLLTESAAVSSVLQVALEIGLSEAEAMATIRSGLSAGQQSPRTIPRSTSQADTGGEADPLAEELARLGETDADNAQRLGRRFGGRLVCTPGKDYLIYDGKRWRRDDQRQRFGFAEATARAIVGEAVLLTDHRDRARRAGFAAASLSKTALDRMLDVAKHRLMKPDRLFDADQWRLNVTNGTLELRTGILHDHDSNDLLTKLVPVAYDPDATCPVFDRFLDRALNGDTALVAYVQKAIGYSLTGVTSEQVFFFPHGPGSTGKSTFVNLIREMLGDYGLHSPTETFTAKQHDNGIPTDLARLVGVRMVTAVEVNWTRQIDEARVKALTGGDPIAARHLYQDFFEFQPACKLWFVANDLPGVRGTAEAFWRRVHLIPFEIEIPYEERDDMLVEKLRAEWPGILAWAVRGCRAWQRDGLDPPEAVRRGTAGWRRKADHLPKFCTEELVPDQGNVITSHDLYQRYQGWCEQHGEKPLDTRKFKSALESRDLTHRRTRTGSVWSGVKLRLQG